MTLTEKELLDFVRSLLLADEHVDADTELFSSALLDSIAMMNLIAYIEERTGVQVAAHEVTLENFDSTARILAYLAKQS